MPPTSVSLQPAPIVDYEVQSLSYLIRALNEQRGPFRDIDEDTLQAEIDQLEDEEQMQGIDGAGAVVDAAAEATLKKEETAATRQQILDEIGQAQHQSAVALDMISLLMSSRNPTTASLTMSPFIKQNIPSGSIGAEVLRPQARDDAQADQDAIVTLGWRVESMNSAADTLLHTATRLQEEVGKETAYWEQILAVKQRGWPISRLPREKHTLGIRFGFLEARSNYADRGFAALRQSTDGRVVLDHGSKMQMSSLRLRLIKGSAVISEWTNATARGETNSLEQEILERRNQIYDEELVYELNREAQYLANQGVQSVGDALILPFDQEKKLEISLTRTGYNKVQKPGQDNTILSVLSLALRVLLSEAFRQTLLRRSKVPAPLRDGRRQRPIHPILKSVLDVTAHHSNLEQLRTNLERTQKILHRAGIPFKVEWEHDDIAQKEATTSKTSEDDQSSRLSRTLASLTTNKVHLTLLEDTEEVRIIAQTSVSAPNFGTTYRLISHEQSEHARTIVCPDLQELQMDLNHKLQQLLERWALGAPEAPRRSKGGAIQDPASDELETLKAGIHIVLDGDRLTVTRNAQVQGGWEHQYNMGWQWYAGEESISEPRSLKEVIDSILGGQDHEDIMI